jgi:hypothetical protein
MIKDERTKFANEIDGQILVADNNSCTVIKLRDIDVTIQDRPSKSPLVLAAMFSYEYDSESDDEDALCLLKIPVKENEINLLITLLKNLDFKIDSLNNNWLKTDPPIYYVSAHVIDDPTIFSINVSNIFRILKL